MSAQPRIMVSFSFKRVDTTGSYVLGAVIDLLGRDAVTFVDPVQFDCQFDTDYDLYLAVDDDGEWTFPEAWQPCAVWLCDTHMDFNKRLRRAAQFNYTFAAQWDGTRMLLEDGIDTAEWLPLACYPAIHHPVETEKKYDLGFVGHLVRSEWLPPERMDLADQLRGAFPQSFFGEAYFEEMCEVYSASRIGWNRSIRDDQNMRTFEVMASGTMLLTNNVPGQDTLFTPGIHYAVYDDAEVVETAHYWLVHEQEREQIARAGLDHVRRYHTYQHRVARILEKCLGVSLVLEQWPYPQPHADVSSRQSEGVSV